MDSSDDYDGITLFAAIKTFYENGNDVLSAICCLALVTVNDGENIESIKKNFHNKYKVVMPVAVLQTILKRLRRKGYIEYEALSSGVHRTKNGKEEAARLSSSVDGLKREFAALISDLGSYFIQHKYSALEDPEKALLSFIDDNLGYASLVLTSSDLKKIRNDVSHIAEYIVHVEKNEPNMFVLLQNIFFGRLYLSIIQTRTEYSTNVNMDPTEIYLDTSIVMSLLGLHEQEDCERAKELLGILKSAKNIKICLFSDTVDEARRLLESYQVNSVDYTKNIRVNTIYSVLKRQGYDKYRVSLLIESLEDKIHKLGISINDTRFSVDTSEYSDIRSNIATWAELIENPKGQNTLDHDASALYGISRLRDGVRSKLFEKCHAVFVTPDRTIHEVTKEIAEKDSRFPLSMFPLDIVCMLWMRDIGNAEIATNVLRQSVMAYVREKAISHKLWDTFISALKDAQGQEWLSKDDIALILASDDVSRLLAEKQYEAPKEIIDPGYIAQLRVQRKKLSDNAKYGAEIISGIRGKIHKISHTSAMSLTTLVVLVAASLIVWGLYWLAASVGLDRFASIVTLLVCFSPLVGLTVFGKEIKLNSTIIGLRERLYNRLYSILHGRLEKLVIGETSNENTIKTASPGALSSQDTE